MVNLTLQESTMFRIKNVACNTYVMLHSCYNGVIRTPETVNVKLARNYSKKEAQKVLSELHANLEFKKYKMEKCS